MLTNKLLMYVVVDLQGHQYIVKQGDKIIVDKVNVNEGEKLENDRVLLSFDEKGENVVVGKPYLEGKKVVFKVIKHFKGDKINVIKFKNKNRYFRKYGFRPYYSILQVEEIS